MTAGELTRPFPDYLRLARRSSGNWWRLVAGVVAGTFGFLVVTVGALLAVAGVVRLAGGHLVVSTNHVDALLLLATNVGLALCIPLAGLLALLVHGTRARYLGSTAPGLRWRWLLTCVGVTSVVWGALFLLLMLAVAVSPKARLDAGVAGAVAVVLLTTPLQAAGEEYLFRGFLLQALGATRLPAWVCWVVSGAVFATAHGQFAPPLFADRLLIGVVFAWLTTSTGGLEASISIHALKNVSVLIPAAFLGQLSGAVQPTGVTWVPVALDAVMLAAVCAWIRSRARHRRPLPGVAGDLHVPRR